MATQESFGQLVRRYRRDAELTQEALAERAGISVRAVRDIEAGSKHRPRQDTVQLLMAALAIQREDQAAFLGAARQGAVREEPSATQASSVQTFLVADVRGYTRFTAEQGDEATAQLATRFADLTEEVVASHGGEVVELRGDSALAAFTSSREAFRTALELQERFRLEREAHPELPLAVGIGIDAGESVPVKGGYRGKALNLASRLQALAASGEVLVSEGAVHLAGAMEGVEYTIRGLVELKGFADPVRVMEVVPRDRAEPVAAASPRAEPENMPIGDFLGALPQSPLVARDDELERLLALVERVIRGQGQCVLLAGERGSGKTRLAQEVMLVASNHRFLVAAGRCYENQQTLSYAPVQEMLAATVGRAPQAVRLDLLRRWPALVALLPQGVLAVSTEDEAPDPHRVAEAMTGFLQTLAADIPVGIFIDDLQWADEQSLRLLQHLVRHTKGQRILLVCTYRDSHLEERPGLARMVRDLGREHLVERVPVRRFSPEGTAAMVASTVGEMEASDEFVEFVHRRTHGSPFYVTRMLQTLGGHYRLVREIGAGGMGRVFEAVDVRTGERVAAKLMLARSDADTHALQRFEQEGQVLETLQHPHIVEVKGTFIDEHASCIIMELLSGRSLGQVIAEEQLSLERIKAIGVQVADALACAHQHQVAHRDIKPDNIMVDEADGVKVTDFGIARMLRPDVTMHTMLTTGLTLGTPYYMAPEQIEGQKVDGRADIYSLGAVLYQLTTGQVPFPGEDPIAIAVQHLKELPIPPRQRNPAIPHDWEAVILKALAKDPADRFQSAAQMEAALSQLGVEGAGPARVEPAAPETAPTPRRLTGKPLTLGGGVVVLLALVLILAVVHPFQSSGSSSGNLKPVAVWPAHGPGVFKNPDGVAVDSQGNIYVADQLTNSIQKLSPSGQPLAEWGGSGSGPGQFSGPAGVAVDSQGNIYVADTGNSRIQKLSSSGLPMKQWGQFSSPIGIALDRQGNIYVADAGKGRVQILSPAGHLLHQWGSPNSHRFQYPVGVAVDAKGDIYVSDGQTGRIEKLSSRGRSLGHWGRQGTGSGAFGDPAGLAVDAQGNVYVADQANNTVQKFSSSGVFEVRWGAKGSGPGRFRSPQALAVDKQGHVVVADSGNHRIQQLSSTGRPIAAWTRTGTGSIFKQPTGIAVDARGHVYVAGGAVDGKVFELTSEGSPAPGWTVPSDSTGHQYASVAVGPGGRIYVADQLNSVVLVFSSAGQQLPAWSGPVSTPFYGPEGIAFGQSAVYVADTGNDRIVKLSATGKPLAELGGVGVAEGNFVAPAAVAVDTAGNIYAVDKSDDTVQRISPQGQFTAQWAGSGSGNGQLRSPSAIAVDGQGHVYVADTGNNRVEEFSSSGQFVRIWGTRGSRPGQFQFPSGIAVDSTGKVYVADTRNNRIQKFAPPGS